RTWGSALSADALTYLPLLLLWAVIILPVAERAAFRLFWAAVAAVGVGKAALLATIARRQLSAAGSSEFARRISAVAGALSVVGRVFAPVILIALAARWHMLHLYDGLAAPEEGLLAHAAQAIVAGDILYRDLRSVFPPGAPYLHAGMFAAVGKTLVVGKIALGVGPVLLPLAVYYLSQRVMPAGIAFVAAALVGLTGEGSVAAFLALCAIGVGFARSGDRRANWALAGALTGLAAAFDVMLGVSAAGAVVVMLTLRQQPFVMRRVGSTDVDLALGGWALAPFALGIAVVWAPIVLYFASRGALAPMGGDLLAGARGEVTRLLRPASEDAGARILGSVYAVGAGLLLWRLAARRLSEADFVALTMIVFGAIALWWSLGTADPYHLAWSAPAAYMLAVWLFGWATKAAAQSVVGWPPWDHLRVLRSAAAALVLIGAAVVLLGWSRPAAGRLEEIAQTRAMVAPPAGWRPVEVAAAGGAYLPERAAHSVEKLVEYVQRHTLPGEALLCGPASPAIYFLAERPHATRLDYWYAGNVAPGDAAEAVVGMESDKLRMAVVAVADAPWQRDVVAESVIIGYVARQYQRVARFGDYLVFLRKGASLTPRVEREEEDETSPGGPAPRASMFGP
ncbi:MAG: hypothetical protein JSV65_11825, partial [Armatimonadota bacterium]